MANRLCVEFTVSGLRKILEFRNDVSGWGTGEALTVEAFYAEILNGESILCIEESGLFRKLRIVKLIIEDPERGTLLEDYQILPDGRRKNRQQTPGGKIGANESPEAAVIREMNEELDLREAAYQFYLGEPYTEEKASKSYPNLRSVYEIYPAHITFFAHTNKLIQDGYNTVDKEDGKKKLFFKWSGKK